MRLINANNLKDNINGWYSFMRDIRQQYMTLSQDDIIGKIDNCPTVKAIPTHEIENLGEAMGSIVTKTEREKIILWTCQAMIWDLLEQYGAHEFWEENENGQDAD